MSPSTWSAFQAKWERSHGYFVGCIMDLGSLILLFLILLPIATLAKDRNWIAEKRDWAVSNASNPNCKVFYTTGWVRPNPLGNQIAWGLMTDKQFKWYSTDGVKKYPSVCFTDDVAKAKFKILFAQGPVSELSGADTETSTKTNRNPIEGTVTDQSGQEVGTISGSVTTTETTTTTVPYSRSSEPVDAYIYRGKDNSLVGTASMAFTHQTGGSGASSIGYNLGSAFGSPHHFHQFLESTLKSIAAQVHSGD